MYAKKFINCTSKLWLKGGLLFRVKNQMWQPVTDFEFDSPSGLSWYFTNEVGLSGSKEICILLFQKWLLT